MKLINRIEPENLINTFMAEPPEGFQSISIDTGNGFIPGFIMKFNILTTTDEKIKKLLSKVGFLIPKPKAMFIGTTVTEYSIFPEDIPPDKTRKLILSRLKEIRSSFLIVKDIPLDSPLLSDEENRASKEIMKNLEENKFQIIYGEALAFVRININSIDEYLKLFSRSRRKDIKRKLKSKDEITVEEISTGDPFFDNETVSFLYMLYMNVYNQSTIHFDLLTESFFKRLFQEENGLVFLYRNNGKIIGFNLCYRAGNKLIDKYIGLDYPDARTFNLYFVSWINNIDYCIKNRLEFFVAGWSDPEIKANLGSEFTFTYHAIYLKNPLLRFILKKIKFLLEADKNLLEKLK